MSGVLRKARLPLKVMKTVHLLQDFQFHPLSPQNPLKKSLMISMDYPNQKHLRISQGKLRPRPLLFKKVNLHAHCQKKEVEVIMKMKNIYQL